MREEPPVIDGRGTSAMTLELDPGGRGSSPSKKGGGMSYNVDAVVLPGGPKLFLYFSSSATQVGSACSLLMIKM